MTTLHHRTIGREGFDWFRVVDASDPKERILGQGFDAEEARARAKEQERKTEAHNNGGSPTK